MKDELIKLMLEEIREAEKSGREIMMFPIYTIYQTTPINQFLSKARDYIWFGEGKDDYF